MTFDITRRIEIDAGHRIPDHGSKCKNLHGHRYVVEATVRGTLKRSGPEAAMVMDFGFVKEVMVQHVHDTCDHGLILSIDDPLLFNLFTTTGKPSELIETFGKYRGHPTAALLTECVFGKLYLIEHPPTAEVLAAHWFTCMEADIFRRSQAALTKVRVYETPNCFADYPVR